MTLFILPSPPSTCCPAFLPVHYLKKGQFRVYSPPVSHLPSSKLPCGLRNSRKVKRNNEKSRWEENALHCRIFYTLTCVTVQNEAVSEQGFADRTQKVSFLFHICIHSVLSLGAIAKLRKATIKIRHVCVSVRPSVRPHGTTRLALDGISWNLIFENFSKICRENSS
jgi:hypothetical protein